LTIIGTLNTSGATRTTNITAAGSIRGKEIHVLNTAFKDEIDTDEIYIPFNSTTEKNLPTGLNTPFVVPCAGRVLKVLYRCGGDQSSATATWRLRTVPNDETITAGHAAIRGTTSCTGPNTDEVATADFLSLSSGTNEFAAEDTLWITIQNDVDVGGESNYFVTVLLELYYNTLGY